MTEKDLKLQLEEYPLDTISITEVTQKSQETVQASSTNDTGGSFPSLEYDIASKKRSIAISAVMVLLINGLIPAIVYYIFQYGTRSPRSLVITVVEISTTFTVIHWPWRLWLLRKNNGERAPRTEKGSFVPDMFQLSFLIGILLVSIFCIVAGIKEDMRWYMFGFVALIGTTATVFIITWFFARAEAHIPFRMSSLPKGSIIRPGIYYIIEDLTACEGAGGRQYRERLNIRWQSSSSFRKLLNDITLISSISLIIGCGVQFIVLFATPEKVFVGLSTLVLWGWFGMTLLWGWKFAKTRLELEKEKWKADLEDFRN